MSMLYVIIGEDSEDSLTKRKVQRTEHLAPNRLQLTGVCNLTGHQATP